MIISRHLATAVATTALVAGSAVAVQTAQAAPVTNGSGSVMVPQIRVTGGSTSLGHPTADHTMPGSTSLGKVPSAGGTIWWAPKSTPKPGGTIWAAPKPAPQKAPENTPGERAAARALSVPNGLTRAEFCTRYGGCFTSDSAWCQEFTWRMWVNGFVPGAKEHPNKGTRGHAELSQKRGMKLKYSLSQAKPGDVVFWDWGGNHRHVAIVIRVDKTGVYVGEGNYWSNAKKTGVTNHRYLTKADQNGFKYLAPAPVK